MDATSGVTFTSGTSLSIAHTVTGSNTILFVAVQGLINNDAITGVGYNTTSMLQVSKIQMPSSLRWVYLFYLTNPSTGTNNYVVTSNTSGNIGAGGVSYTGASQSGQPDASTANVASAANSITSSVISVADNCWTVIASGNNLGTASAGTGTTSRASGVDGTSIMDSNGAITPAGSTSLQLTTASPTIWGTVMASFSPFVAGTVTRVSTTLNLLGVGQ